MGFTFESDRDLSKQLGKCKSYVAALKDNGLSYEDIISKVITKGLYK